MADNLNFNWGMTANLASVGAVAGTGGSITTTVASNAVINGKFALPMAPLTNAALPSVDAATGQPFVTLTPNQVCSLVFGVNSAGQLLACQSRALATGAGGALAVDPQFPGLPNDFCPIAYTVVRTAAGAAPWTPGVSAWNASNTAASAFQNVAQLPNRPQAM